MKKIILVFSLAVAALVARADEGMWTLYNLPQAVYEQMKGYGFQIEMKFTAWKLGFNIKEVPIIFTDRKQGKSQMSGGIFNEAVWGVIGMKIGSWFKNYKRKE